MDEWKDHVKNVLLDILRNPPAVGENVASYLEKKADLVISFVPEDQRPKSSKRAAIEKQIVDLVHKEDSQGGK